MSTITCGIFLYDEPNKSILSVRAFGGRKFESLSVPKGHYDSSDASYLDTALREFREETSFDIEETFGADNLHTNKNVFFIGDSEYKNVKKTFKGFLIISKIDLSEVAFFCSSFFERAGESFPEVCDYTWLTLDEAQEKLHVTQSILIPKIKKIVTHG